MKTVDCDWMKVANQTAHRTSEYENKAIVLRRGQTFQIKATFQREFNETADQVFLEFSIGKNAQEMYDTKIRLSVSETLNPNKWSMALLNTDDHSITVEVSIPPNAIIGRYKTVVEFSSKLESGEVATSRDAEPDVIILFNPWCKDDAVFLDDDAKREEYVLNDIGSVYRGSSRRISAKKWNFGQFEADILDTVLYLLDNDKRTALNSKWLQKRRNPVWVCRVMSTMCSAANDGGVLEGNWSGKYDGGVSPLSWNGSVKILKQFHDTKKPVKYGQCWVFSGLLTTVLRSLGIPTRSVTNFASAHDTEGSMTIDSYVNEDGDDVDLSDVGLGGDSVWNFHVWNESWMARTDLPSGYGGWQAVDSTPQEISLGLFQTGPAPLVAIKKGEVYLGYETPFVFAEVNSDRVTWVLNNDNEVLKVGRRYTRAVGKNISTKMVGEDEREDVTHEYKHTEGTEEERAAFRMAYGFGSQPEYQKGFLELQEEDPTDGIDMEISSVPGDDELFHGEPFALKVELKNTADVAKTVTLATSLHSTDYTGTNKSFLKRKKFEPFIMEPGTSATKDIPVAYADYGGKLNGYSSLKLVAVASVKETKKMFSEDYEFNLITKDSVEIEIQGDGLQVGKRSNVIVKFKNPLPVKLTHVTVTLEGAGLADPAIHKIGVVPADGAIESIFPVVPKRAGKYRMLVADVDSRQMQDMKQHRYVPVEEKPEEPEPAPEAPKEENVAAEAEEETTEAEKPAEDKPQDETTEEKPQDETTTEKPEEGATANE